MLLQQPIDPDLDLARLALNLVLVLVAGHVLAWHFVRYAQVLANKRKLARVLVFISATTLLIITVVKSSLALSLGLVGALSIIRFRTPVKEPEELAYLFLAIAAGVGFGADRLVETAVVLLVVLAVMAVRSHIVGSRMPLRTVLEVEVDGRADGRADGQVMGLLLPAVTAHCGRVDLRRVDSHAAGFHASLLVELPSVDRAQQLIDAVRQALPSASVSLVERDTLD
jgi:hypothetical protein